MMKHVSIGALISAAAFWNYMPPYERIFGFVYMWAAAFYAIAVVVSPFFPAGTFSGIPAIGIVAATFGLFAYSLYALKTQPFLPAPCITDRNSGSRSLWVR
jgi:hypothetical protein